MLPWLSDRKYQLLIESINKALPQNYDFEIIKTLTRLSQVKAKSVCLQFPEGLLAWADTIAFLIEEFADGEIDVFVVGDVVYGACCIDDIRAAYFDCDFLVHYAHSCLVKVSDMDVPCLYIFVKIKIDPEDFVKAIKNIIFMVLPDASGGHSKEATLTKLHLNATVQYIDVVHFAYRKLVEDGYGDRISIPICSPLSPGETLGCTSAKLNGNLCVFLADGRFHIESSMIQNPHVVYYRFDPFTRRMFLEKYDHQALYLTRNRVLRSVRINPRVPYLNEFTADLIVNVGCPRMSIDWGAESCHIPFISTFE
uniref:2-(3-amino-3-carboxypropyl)histidine synthase subunit 1 n=1 Tax=Dermatophagoides pteronyssinus TaxID=6956 RepID=A0A6P6YBU3_DERPT|nr:2-(3-amino-3-carboxypropyl)histidine synthase subunit 1-like [Dermatophagoides pteronyssinus]